MEWEVLKGRFYATNSVLKNSKKGGTNGKLSVPGGQ
jgi:hypothetical protein